MSSSDSPVRKPPVRNPPVKRKHASSSSEDSDGEETTSSSEESDPPKQATKRAKHVITSVPLGSRTPVKPLHLPGPGRATAPPPPVVGSGPTTPRLIRSASTGNAVSDDVFNATRVYNYRRLSDAADAVSSNRSSKKLSEALGEEGAVAYLRAYTGYGDIELHHATPTNPHTLPETRGSRWSHAVAFNGAGVADITYWDGFQLHVIEAKGGGSALGERKQARFHRDIDGSTVMNNAMNAPKARESLGAEANLRGQLANRDGSWKAFKAGDPVPNSVKTFNPNMLRQGTKPYLIDIGHTMAASPKTDGRVLIGRAIINHSDNVHYQPVSTKVAEDGGPTVQTMDV